MKIALCTRSFRPEIGGIGTVTHSFALGLIEHGCEPVVVTSTPAPEGYDAQFSYRVIRQPGFLEFRRVLRGCDGVIFTHQSIVYILWSVLLGKPVLSSIQGQIWNWSSMLSAVLTIAFEMHLRIRPRVALISEAVRSPATRNAPVIGNPHDRGDFHAPDVRAEPGTVIFSGRVIRAKGVFHLVEAVRLLRRRGVPLKVTFVGAGPDEAELRDAIAAADLSGCTTLIGHSEPRRVAELLGQNQIAAIPSDWDEPFGIVALEAIACGCYVVAFPDGGLPLAVGEAGLVTSEKSAAALADGIQRLLTDETLRRRIDGNRIEHLEKFSRGTIAARLLELLRSTPHWSPKTK